MRRYLRLTRAHTVPLEAVPAAVGALLATGGEFTLGVYYWTAFGILYHLAGYGHNSYTDWRNGYDKEDPNKQHHPLNRGSIGVGKARVFVYSLISLTLFLVSGGIIIYRAYEAFLLIMVALAAGIAYNEIGKLTVMKPIIISVAHSMVFAVPYLSLGGEINSIFISALLFVFLWVVFQIAISGEVKDIHQDEENILLRLGVKRENGEVSVSNRALIVSLKLRLLVVLVGFITLIAAGGETEHMMVLSFVAAMSLIKTVEMMQYSINTRMAALGDMAMIEIMSLAMFLIATSPVIGWSFQALLFLASGVWVVSLNKYLWGTFIAPDV